TWAAEIKLRAWRRLGEISRGLAKRQNQHDALPIIGRAKNEVLAQAGASVGMLHEPERKLVNGSMVVPS
ncbi:MAG: hypothetical protein VST67_12960, partial [Nitrospirota bacterium]|nr:hypothetical protein [Nitrospirota bacterium]